MELSCIRLSWNLLWYYRLVACTWVVVYRAVQEGLQMWETIPCNATGWNCLLCPHTQQWRGSTEGTTEGIYWDLLGGPPGIFAGGWATPGLVRLGTWREAAGNLATADLLHARNGSGRATVSKCTSFRGRESALQPPTTKSWFPSTDAACAKRPDGSGPLPPTTRNIY